MTACEKAKDPDREVTKKGGYVETEAAIPKEENSDGKSLWKHPDGSFDYITADSESGKYRWFHSKDGEEWKEQETEWQSKLKGKIDLYSVAEDGTVFAATITQENPTKTMLWKVEPGKAPEELKLEADRKALQKGEYAPGQLMALPGNRLFLSYVSSECESAALYDTGTKKEIAALDNWYYGSCAANSKTLFQIDYTGRVHAVDLLDGKPLAQYNATVKNQVKESRITVDEEGNIYYFTSSGLCKLTAGGAAEGEETPPADETAASSSGGTADSSADKTVDSSADKTILDKNRYSFGSPVWNTTDMAYGTDGEIFMVLSAMNGGSCKLLKYKYDPQLTFEKGNTLTVFSLHESKTVRAAIIAYQQKHSSVKINYEVALEDNAGSQTAQDVIKTLNTEILTGKGPDVLILDGLPIDSYIQKGMLEDLTPLVTVDGMEENIRKAFSKDEHIYAIPAGIRLPALFGQEDILKKCTSLEGFLQLVKGSDKPVISFQDLLDVFDFLYSSGASDLVRDELNTEEFETFLKDAKLLSDQYELSDISTERTADPEGMTFLTETLNGYFSGTSLLGYQALDSVDFTTFVLGEGSTMAIAPGLGEGGWLPINVAGINSQSRNKKPAAEFISILLSREIQDYSLQDGLPVLEQSAELQLANANAGKAKSGFPVVKIDFSSIYSKLNTPVIVDSDLKEKLLPVMEQYCKGELSLETAVSEAKQQTQTYLAEKK
jgi:ABC-type glycerol-3-phosphate transport system substrate-binding protein